MTRQLRPQKRRPVREASQVKIFGGPLVVVGAGYL